MKSVYVDDVLLAATPEALLQFEHTSKQRFDMKINSSNNFSYFGLDIPCNKFGEYTIPQQ